MQNRLVKRPVKHLKSLISIVTKCEASLVYLTLVNERVFHSAIVTTIGPSRAPLTESQHFVATHMARGMYCLADLS